MLDAVGVLNPLMAEAFGNYTLINCTHNCLTYSIGAPFGTSPDERAVWAFFYRYNEGHYLETVGLELLVNMTGGGSLVGGFR